MAERIARVEIRLDGLEDGMARLDTRMEGLDSRLRVLEISLSAVNAKLDLLTTQIVAELPSWWQMPAVIVSTVALLTGLFVLLTWLGKLGYL